MSNRGEKERGASASQRLFAWVGALVSVAEAACAPSGSQVPAPVVEIPPHAEGTAVAPAPQAPPRVPRPSLAPECASKSPAVAHTSAPLGGSPAGGRSAGIMGPYFGGGLGFYPIEGAAPGSRASADAGPLELRLSAPHAELAPGAAIALDLAFANLSKGPLVLVRPLDGSLEGWRYPRYDLYARDESDGAVYRFAFVGARCGNVNSIGDADYVSIPPGGARSDVADGWANYLRTAALPKPGRYTLWVVYVFCGFETEGVPLGADVVREDAYRGAHASNPVGVIVR